MSVRLAHVHNPTRTAAGRETHLRPTWGGVGKRPSGSFEREERRKSNENKIGRPREGEQKGPTRKEKLGLTRKIMAEKEKNGLQAL